MFSSLLSLELIEFTITHTHKIGLYYNFNGTPKNNSREHPFCSVTLLYHILSKELQQHLANMFGN